MSNIFSGTTPGVRLKFKVAIGVLLIIPALTACGTAEDDQLNAWISDQRKALKPRVAPISPPSKFVPEQYGENSALDPFSNIKLTSALKRDSKKSGAGEALIKPEAARRKEPLEAVSLETMAYVGNLLQNSQRIALVKVGGLLHQIKVGNHLGQNFGKVLKISESEMVLREIVQDLDGEWIERPSTLQLQQTVGK